MINYLLSYYPMSIETSNPTKMRTIRSFVLRKGRMTNQQDLVGQRLWAKYGLDHSHGRLLDLQAVFGINAPIVVEIGFGNGKNLLQLAQQHSEFNFIGIEVYASGVAQLLTAIEQAGVNNLRIMRGDAVEILTNNLPPQSCQLVQLFFPDPWPKARHHKRRLVQATFASLVADKLIPGGVFHIATDWADYATHSQTVMADTQEFSQLPAPQLSPFTLNRLTTKFEQRGQLLGHQIFDLAYRRN